MKHNGCQDLLTLSCLHPPTNEEGKPAGGDNNSCSFPLEAEDILCIGKGSHCLQISHEAWGLRYNHSHFTASTFLLSTKSFKVGNNTTEGHPPTLVSLCPIPEVDAEISFYMDSMQRTYPQNTDIQYRGK